MDTGALIGLDHPASEIMMQARLDEVLRRVDPSVFPLYSRRRHRAGLAWPKASRLARLIRSRDVDIAVMTLSVARTVGEMCAESGHADIIDAHVALCAREREHAVLTSDPDDLAQVDPALPLIRV